MQEYAVQRCDSAWLVAFTLEQVGLFFSFFLLFFLKRGNVLCTDEKLSGFVILGAAVPPTSTEPQCSWTTHHLLFAEKKRTSGVGEMLDCSCPLDSLNW